MSVISNKSFAGVQPSASNKHIFHHVKHGELAANFVSTNSSVLERYFVHKVTMTSFLISITGRCAAEENGRHEVI